MAFKEKQLFPRVNCRRPWIVLLLGSGLVGWLLPDPDFVAAAEYSLRSPWAATRRPFPAVPHDVPILAADDREPGFENGDFARRLQVLADELREWEARDDEELRAARMARLDALLSEADVLALLAGLPPQLADYAFGLPCVRALMETDPRAVIAWMQAHREVGDGHLLTVVAGWRRSDGAAFRDYALALPAGSWRQAVLSAIVQDRLQEDPTEALVWAGHLKAGAERDRWLLAATCEWARHDAIAAAEWVVREGGGTEWAERLCGAVAEGLASADAGWEATRWLAETVSPGPILDGAAFHVASRWALSEPAAAGLWVSRLPAGHTRQQALEGVLRIWRHRDPEAAARWVAALSDENLQDQALALLKEEEANGG